MKITLTDINTKQTHSAALEFVVILGQYVYVYTNRPTEFFDEFETALYGRNNDTSGALTNDDGDVHITRSFEQ